MYEKELKRAPIAVILKYAISAFNAGQYEAQAMNDFIEEAEDDDIAFFITKIKIKTVEEAMVFINMTYRFQCDMDRIDILVLFWDSVGNKKKPKWLVNDPAKKIFSGYINQLEDNEYQEEFYGKFIIDYHLGNDNTDEINDYFGYGFIESKYFKLLQHATFDIEKIKVSLKENTICQIYHVLDNEYGSETKAALTKLLNM